MNKILLFCILFIILFTCQFHASAETKSREKYEKTGRVIWEVNTAEKLVAVTFDDGPHPIFTPQILDLLAKYNAKATFFVAGNKVQRFPKLLKREVNEGHEIANHTFHHIYSNNITSSTLESELQNTDNLIEKTAGIKPTLFRPVGGLYNDVIINTAIKNKKDVILWTWHQDSRDWADPPVNQICQTILKGIKPGNIILFHDWHGSEFTKSCQTVKALDNILAQLSEDGYRCVTVSELLYHSAHIIPDYFQIYPIKKNENSHIDLVF